MKIALSSLGRDVNSKLSEVFGRCPYFIFAEIENSKIQTVEAIENISAKQQGGAGISAAQMVAENKVDVVIAGTFGPRALDVLKQFNIRVFKGSGLIKEVIKEYADNKLREI